MERGGGEGDFTFFSLLSFNQLNCCESVEGDFPRIGLAGRLRLAATSAVFRKLLPVERALKGRRSAAGTTAAAAALHTISFFRRDRKCDRK